MEHVTGRFAPSPSGPLHLGNLACALMAYLSARSQGGRFLLRIEDLDRQRCPRTWSEMALRDLEALGLEWDAPPIWQSERDEIYRGCLDILQKKGAVYPCFCTRAEIMQASLAPNRGDTQRVYPGTCRYLPEEVRAEKMRTQRYAWRLRVPDREIGFTDRVQGEYVENLSRDCGDFVVRRSDGLFAYQLAVVVDDALSGVTEVVRGCDILSATPRQIYLAQLLGFPSPTYAHIPLLTDANGRRLAKRDHDVGFAVLRERMGIPRLRGLLGYAMGIWPRDAEASMQELIDAFSWEHVHRDDVRLPC